ncbi:LOB domain-containing protein 6 [Canna indica]|uniref:LOB domain-containing protein 6 n=1 Tax=Canna indica TaxID=4628 RepID=A0AAQ3Q313_9LILI|nr:LOB domain-containing protein 6 [Canna indica]
MVWGAASPTRPCAACKLLRRKCQPDCALAPYFPPDQPQKFAHVHRVFGASNVTKLLNEVHPHQREDAVNSLAYEADMRLRCPVYGCAGAIFVLQEQLRQLQLDLALANAELSELRQQLAAAVPAGNGPVDFNRPAGFGFNHFDLSPAVSKANRYQGAMLRGDYDDESVDGLAAATNHVAAGGACGHTGGEAAALIVSAGSVLPSMGEQFLKPGMAGGYQRPAFPSCSRY